MAARVLCMGRLYCALRRQAATVAACWRRLAGIMAAYIAWAGGDGGRGAQNGRLWASKRVMIANVLRCAKGAARHIGRREQAYHIDNGDAAGTQKDGWAGDITWWQQL